MSRRENFYRRDPGLALAGMASMSLEERGVYNTILDLLYLTWRPLEDDRGYIAGHCRCAVQKLNPILNRLVAAGKLIQFEEGGQTYISNPKFEDERNEVKGPAPTRSGRGKVREKSAGVEEKSAGVSQNPPLLNIDTSQNQSVTALDRVDKSREDPPLAPPGGQQAEEGRERRKPARSIPEGFPTDDLIAEHQAKAREAGADVDAGYQAERFRNWAVGKDAKYADWTATWRNWMAKAIREAPKTPLAASMAQAKPTDGWARRVREFRTNGYWDAVEWGPAPNREGCKAPADLLAQHGFGGAAVLPFPVSEGRAA